MSRALLFVAAVMMLALVSCGKSAVAPATPTPSPTPTSTATPLPPTVTAVPTRVPQPTPTPLPPEGNRIRIPRIGVDAPLKLSTLDASGVLQEPDTPDDVLVYDFSKYAGVGGWFDGGNLVLAGYARSEKPCNGGRMPPPCAGVFYSINQLVPGDRIQVWWDKQEYVYTVVSTCTVDAAKNFEPIVKYTDVPAITLITGAGDEDATLGSTQRLVVRGEQKQGTLSSDCPG